MVYETYEELKNNDLKLHDEIIFKYNGIKYYYEVKETFLKCYKIVDLYDKQYEKWNDAIFTVLNINRYNFCEKYYKSIPINFYSGIFPYYKSLDFESAKNVILALFLCCDDFKSNKNIWED